MTNLLTIEPERDEIGYHAAIIDLGNDAVLHVTDSFAAVADAIRAAPASARPARLNPENRK